MWLLRKKSSIWSVVLSRTSLFVRELYYVFGLWKATLSSDIQSSCFKNNLNLWFAKPLMYNRIIVIFRWIIKFPIISRRFHDKTSTNTPRCSSLINTSQYVCLLILLSLQEPITRTLQPPRNPVTAFLQTHLFLVWIYLVFRSPQEPHWPIAITSTD